MLMNDSPTTSWPIGTLLVLVFACGLYVAMLLNVYAPAGGGEARIANAYQVFFLTLYLWITLAVFLVVCGVLGAMPGKGAAAALFLLPLSGVAAFAAIDMADRHRWAILFPMLLPPLIALYGMWARLPELHAKYPAGTTGMAIWGAVLVLSLAALVAAI